MIHAIAIDDEPKALDIVNSLASRIPFLNLVKSFTNPMEALQYVNDNAIDLIFVDIKMPDISGLDLVQALKKKECLVIFTTAHSEYALKSYDIQALDYLLKPFDFSRFLKAVTRAQEVLSMRDDLHQDFFFVNTGYQQRKISINDISHLEGDGNYVTYHVNNEKIMVRSTIKEALKLLPPRLFIQIHRSFIISLRKLDKIQDNHAFIGNHKISIGANYKNDFMKSIG
jgi:two-component system LytT family response regulator